MQNGQDSRESGGKMTQPHATIFTIYAMVIYACVCTFTDLIFSNMQAFQFLVGVFLIEIFGAITFEFISFKSMEATMKKVQEFDLIIETIKEKKKQ